ncbi:MAG: hypothetical protein EAZ40_15080 [Rhodobacterales bacterium]|nr:MAG: hypothetical protein EAZ40_15080 [Rhodobacterales bacterium]
MRDPSGPELLLFARALLPIAPEARGRTAARILQEVEAADRHFLGRGCSHPDFGDGSLMARCLLLSPPAEPLARDPDFLAATMIACNALLQHFKA